LSGLAKEYISRALHFICFCANFTFLDSRVAGFLPMLQVDVCVLRWPPSFPAVPLYLDHTPVVTRPSQNRAGAIYAHGSSVKHSHGRVKRARSAMRSSFVFTVSPPLCVGGVSLPRALNLSSPFLGRHYPPSLVLRDDPTPCGAFAILPCFGCQAYSSGPAWREPQGLPGYHQIVMSRMPWSLTPRKRLTPSLCGVTHVDFR